MPPMSLDGHRTLYAHLILIPSDSLRRGGPRNGRTLRCLPERSEGSCSFGV